jgi:Uma2 family endonuclease
MWRNSCAVGKNSRTWNAELIDGVVHVPSPVSREHGSLDFLIHWWLAHYAHAAPGRKGGSNSTWLMLDSAPQPDAYLRILPSHGGQSCDEKRFCTGAPELAVEICLTSTEVDFGPKRKLYRRACVREYITIEVFGNASSGAYRTRTPSMFPKRFLRTALSDRRSFQDCGSTRRPSGPTMARRCWRP